MTDRTGYAHGEFSWVDLNAHDAAAAKRWYGELFGWAPLEIPTQGGPPYTIFTSGGKHVAGLGQMSDEMKAQGIPPCWNSYVNVKDARAVEAAARELGATVTVPTMDVMDAGSLAFFLDPQGASFAVWQPNRHAGAQLVNAPGSFCWNELMTRDVAGARELYGKLFGWEFAEMQVGPMTYTVIRNAGRDNGGMLAIEGVPPHWLVYFAVEDADRVASRAAKVLVPPMDVPPGRLAVVADPQGAAFGVIRLAHPPG